MFQFYQATREIRRTAMLSSRAASSALRGCRLMGVRGFASEGDLLKTPLYDLHLELGGQVRRRKGPSELYRAEMVLRQGTLARGHTPDLHR